MDDIIKINGLCKSFNDVIAVDDLSIAVKRGQFYAFLGLNGAGKSTTISIMCGQLEKDSGAVIIDGVKLDDSNIDAIKSKLGVVFQFSVQCR